LASRTWIPIVSEAEARAHADDFLVLPWHFMERIQTRESDFLARGGKLIAPLPESTHDHRRPMAYFSGLRSAAERIRV
jgi:hypothetical protein